MKRKSLVKYPVEFKIYPNPYKKKEYYMVYFFRTKKDMYNFYLGPENRWPSKKKLKRLNFEAICQSYRIYNYKDNKEVISPEIGSLLFYKKKITSMITSHECCHATIYYVELINRTNIFKDKQQEENFCFVQGHLDRQIWVEYYKNFN